MKKSGSKDKKRAKDKKHKDRERRSSKDKGPVQLSKARVLSSSGVELNISQSILFRLAMLCEDWQRMLCCSVTFSPAGVLLVWPQCVSPPPHLRPPASTRITSQASAVGRNYTRDLKLCGLLPRCGCFTTPP